MTSTDFQLTAADESTYGTAVARTRAWEYESESIKEDEGRTASDPLRLGSGFIRNDRFVPYFAGAAGDVEMTVMTKGFGFWLKHMLGASATTGPAETSVFTHTGTEGNLFGKSFCLQLNRPFNPSGTNQPFLYSGGKIPKWSLQNSVDGMLVATLGMDFAKVDTATALDGSPAYPSGMEPLSWAGGLITIGGVNYDVTEFSLEVDNGLDVGRRQIRANTDKKEPVSTRRQGSFAIKADFDSLTHRNRAHAALRANALASLTAKWSGPVLLGTTIFPNLTITIPQVRFDSWEANLDGWDPLTQELKGEVAYDGSASPITIAYQSADTIA